MELMQETYHLARNRPIQDCYTPPPNSYGYLDVDKPKFLIVYTPRTEEVNIESIFKKYAKKWHEETDALSVTRRKINNENYKKIIELGLTKGKPIVELIFEELKIQGGHWFAALSEITGENPVEESILGDIPKMRETWLSWGSKHGYLR